MEGNGMKTFCIYVTISVTILIPPLIFVCFIYIYVYIFSLLYSFISVIMSVKNICIYMHVNDAEVGVFSKHSMWQGLTTAGPHVITALSVITFPRTDLE
jgi:hypothetical protein